MKQSWQIFRRDIGRLFRVRKAWIIVLGVLITPALYAWFNISAFWDPYSNTSNIRVAVANLDAGADSDLTGPVNVGDQVVDQLKDNDQLGWQFMGEDEAQSALRRGDVYAAIVIPADFSHDLLSMTTGEFTQPALRYFVNEKSSAIAPKITDVGASELDKQITSAFKEQVAQAATDAVKDAGDSVELRLLHTRDGALNAFDRTTKALSSTRDDVARLQDGLDDSRTTVSSARDGLDDVNRTLDDVQKSIAEAQSIIADTQQQIVSFTDAATLAYVKGTTALADASASAHASITRLTQELEQANVRIDSSISEVTAVLEANEQSIGRLQALLDDATLDPQVAQRLSEAIATLQERNMADQALLADLKALNTDTASTVRSVQSAAAAVDQAMQDTRGAATEMRTIITDTVPSVNAAMSQLSASAGAFSAALGAQQTVLAQTDELLAGIDTQLESTSAALDRFDADLRSITAGVRTARADVLALGAASQWGALRTLTGLNPEQIAQFISSPVEVDEQIVFPVASYGSAMAALFTNLSLWIGAFVLMVIFKIEVDTEGLTGVTVWQAYFGRFLLFASLAVCQALIVGTGNLVIGVQTVSAVAFVGTAVLVSLAYVSIVYALSVAFGHVGRGLCVLLVIMQIPGASGLYPIELMPGFFRALYPLLPFSYGIDAMRETSAGFYGGHYWRYLGVLALMVALSFGLGLVLRRRLASFNLLFNRQIASTDLLIGEEVQVVGRGYRLSDVIHALQDRDEYRDQLAGRAESFTRHYPALLRGTVLVGITGVVVLGVVTWAVSDAKALLLGLWSLWCLLIMGFLVIIEYVKESFAHAHELAELDEADLREAVLAESSGTAPELEAEEITADGDTSVLEVEEPVEDEADAGGMEDEETVPEQVDETPDGGQQS